MVRKQESLAKDMWWFIVLSAVASIIFGLLALFWPGVTLVSLIYIFAIFVVVAGAVQLFSSFKDIKNHPLWWLSLLLAIVNLIIGVYLLRNPAVAAGVFIILLAIAIGVRSVFDLVLASYADKQEHKGLWIASGIIGLIAAIVILVYPLSSSVAFVWVLGLYALISGIVGLAYAVQARSKKK